MKRLRFSAVLAALLPSVASTQTRPIPVRLVVAPSLSSERFAEAPNVRALPGGGVLVNDFAGKRLLVFDSLLAKVSVTADSVGASGTSYPAYRARIPLIPFGSDSTLFVDMTAKVLVRIDHNGNAAGVMAVPKVSDLNVLTMQYAGEPGIDNLGRLVYRSARTTRPVPQANEPENTDPLDTIPIVRADFNTRTVDTIAAYAVPHLFFPVITEIPGKKPVSTARINAMPFAPDQWAMLADGTVAILREHDYHIDWIAPDGKKSSSPKLPFDWRRLTDADKQARIDSVRKLIDSLATTSTPWAYQTRSSSRDGGRMQVDTIIPIITFVPLAEMRDYVPPVRPGALKADLDGNLWILPSTSSAAGKGLVYDVVNRKGELFERVRLPADCILVGHGKGGVIYFARTDGDKKWVLGKTRVAR